MKEDKVFVVKDVIGNYFCGFNHWDKQIRNARFYHSKHYETAQNYIGEIYDEDGRYNKLFYLDEKVLLEEIKKESTYALDVNITILLLCVIIISCVSGYMILGKVNVMIYVMSDVHGCLKEFLKMLDHIGFSANDELYIIGDVIDRGASPIKLLRLIMDTPNMHLISGNHELMMKNSICNPSLSNKEKERFMKSEVVMQNRNMWLKNGGVVTERQYSKLKQEDKIKVFYYLNSLPMMKEVQMQNTTYLLIHGGIYEGFKVDYEEGNLSEDILWSYFPCLNETDVIIPGKTFVVGHTPTSCYGYDNKIISIGDKRLIDCGCVFGYSLGCLRLDDEECFYIRNY